MSKKICIVLNVLHSVEAPDLSAALHDGGGFAGARCRPLIESAKRVEFVKGNR
jgi:hypothetical protein